MLFLVNKVAVGLMFIFLLYACTDKVGNRSDAGSDNVNYSVIKEPLIEANKKYVKKQDDEIDQYVKRRGWDMKTSPTGLRYLIYNEGKGKKAEEGMVATVNFKINLLDGSLCYSSDSLGSKNFLIGQDHVESGLHEALTYMKVGDKALFIIPSHLAHGLLGDERKIPPQSSVVYDLELLSLK